MSDHPSRKRIRVALAPAAAASSSTVAAAAAAADAVKLSPQPPLQPRAEPRSILAHMKQQQAATADGAHPHTPCADCPPLREALARSSELVAELQSQLSAARSQFAAAQRQIWSLQMAAKSCFVQEEISYEPLRLVGGTRGAGDHSSHASSSQRSHDHSGRAKMRRTAISRRASDNDDDERADDPDTYLGGGGAAAMPPSLPPLAAAAASSTSASSSSSGSGSTPSPIPPLPACRFCSSPGVYSMRHRSCDGREEELACYCASHESMVTRMLSQWQSQAWNSVDPKTKADCDSCWTSEQLERMLPAKTDDELRAEAVLTQRCHAFTSSGGCRPDWVAEDAVVNSRRLIGLRSLPPDTSPAFRSIDEANPASVCAGASSGRICAREDCCTRVDPLDDASLGDSDSHAAAPAARSSLSARSLRSNLSVVSATIDLHEVLMVERSAVAESCTRSLSDVDRRRHDRLFFFCHAHWLTVARLLAHSHPERGPVQLRPHPRIKSQVFTLDQFMATPEDEPRRLHAHTQQRQGKSNKKNKRSRSAIEEESHNAAAAAAAASAASATVPSPPLSSVSAPAVVMPAL